MAYLVNFSILMLTLSRDLSIGRSGVALATAATEPEELVPKGEEDDADIVVIRE